MIELDALPAMHLTVFSENSTINSNNFYLSRLN